MGYRNLYENLKWLSPSLVPLLYYIYFWIVLNKNPVYTYENIYCHLMEPFQVLYNVKLDDKCETELKGLCRNTEHLSIGQED